ncbi:hypothetical protein V5799_026076 [Amblyomma americanum]|uniref:Secreted protein n=1 Tax=Amblyomma americanum TaxID=6943 RepID=A0AAQ4DJL7_AMBAM
MIALNACLLLALASSAFAGFVSTYGVPVAGYHAVPAVSRVYAAAPAVSTAFHHAPAVSKATRVTSFQTVQPGVPHTVARVSTYTPAAAAVHTVHASAPAAVVGAVHHVPAYSYGYLPARYSYSHRYDAHPLRYRYGYGLTPYGLNYGYGLNTYGYVAPFKKCDVIKGHVSILASPVATLVQTFFLPLFLENSAYSWTTDLSE